MHYLIHIINITSKDIQWLVKEVFFVNYSHIRSFCYNLITDNFTRILRIFLTALIELKVGIFIYGNFKTGNVIIIKDFALKNRLLNEKEVAIQRILYS